MEYPGASETSEIIFPHSATWREGWKRLLLGKSRLSTILKDLIRIAPGIKFGGGGIPRGLLKTSEIIFPHSTTRRGIVLAGGAGTRLYPLTRSVCKQLLPIYDKPLIYYPFATLMEAGISEVLLITTPQDQASFQALLGDGQHWGISISYAQQQRPEGIAQSLIIGRDFIAGGFCALILGDNIFHGVQQHLKSALWRSSGQCPVTQSATMRAHERAHEGASVFAYRVADPHRYGIVEFGIDGTAISIDEKPPQPKSQWAVTGLYFYDHQALEIAASLQPSARGELEITDVNNAYLRQGKLQVIALEPPCQWFDAGTFDSLRQASEYVFGWQERNRRGLGCPEEIAWRNGWIDTEQLLRLAQELRHSGYGSYLESLVTC